MPRTVYVMIAIPVKADYPRRPTQKPLLVDIENCLCDAFKYKEWHDDSRKPLVSLEEKT